MKKVMKTDYMEGYTCHYNEVLFANQTVICFDNSLKNPVLIADKLVKGNKKQMITGFKGA